MNNLFLISQNCRVPFLHISCALKFLHWFLPEVLLMAIKVGVTMMLLMKMRMMTWVSLILMRMTVKLVNFLTFS
uniref:Exocyst complex component sec3 n=1 Tax=Rhizophora mucronata TaxID=61149 RepID=A0A2P2MS90_RHIMU